MDKDLILMVGGALVAVIVIHGMWLTWRARRDRLPMQLAADVPDADYEDGEVLGPPRVVPTASDQGTLGLGDATDGQERSSTARVAADPVSERRASARRGQPAPGNDRTAARPIMADAPVPADVRKVGPIIPDDGGPVDGENVVARVVESASTGRRRVRDVNTGHALSVGIDALHPDSSARTEALAVIDRVAAAAEATAVADEAPETAGEPMEAMGPEIGAAVVDAAPDATAGHRVSEPIVARRDGETRQSARNREDRNLRDRQPRDATGIRRNGASGAGGHRAEAPAEEIFVINVLARDGGAFNGAELFEVFTRNTLKFRDMNVFHRLDPASGDVRFSVANGVEPGIFDLSDMASLETPAVSLFFRLPGPERPVDVLDDMVGVARDIGKSLGGDLKDENMSVLTGQTLSHFKQRMAEFSRKRMSMRAAHG